MTKLSPVSGIKNLEVSLYYCMKKVPKLESLLDGMENIAKAVTFYKKKLEQNGWEKQEAMVFVKSWHDYVLPKLLEEDEDDLVLEDYIPTSND